jgi:hypothetical protein
VLGFAQYAGDAPLEVRAVIAHRHGHDLVGHPMGSSPEHQACGGAARPTCVHHRIEALWQAFAAV